MIHKTRTDSNTIKSYSPTVKWCSVSKPRPVVGVEGVIYANKDKHTFSLWNGVTGEYIEFGAKLSSSTVANESLNSSEPPNNNTSLVFSFVDNVLTITDTSTNVISEIPIPDTTELEAQVKDLTARIEKLEEMLS